MTPEPEDTDPDGALPALTSARVVIYRTDLTSGSIRRSANSRDVLNLPRDGVLDAFRSAIFPEDLAQFDDTIAGVARHAPNYEIEYRIAASPAGAMDHIWVLDRGSGEFDDDGKLVALKGAIVDVSARASIERELRQAARLRQVVFEAARMAAWHLDMASGRFTCTDEILELLEVRREDFGGTTEAVEHAIHPDDREAWHRAHQRARSPGSRVEIEFRVQLKNGAERWLLSRGEVVRSRDGMPFESYGVMIDITARKKSEEDAARLASIVASSEDAILSKSLRGQVTSWNKAAERMFGFTAEEMIGESVWRLIPEDGEHEELNILNTIRLGNTISPYDSVRLHKSGRRIHVSISVSPIRNAKGDVVGASTIARDITEQRRQDEILRENEARLRLALRSARAGAWNFDLVRRELHW